jgi:DNA-binding LytR/AlgR family response regulator
LGDGVIPAAAAPGEREMILQLEGNIYVKNNLQFIKIAVKDIQYLEADNNYVNLWTPERKFALRLSLSTMLEKIQCRNVVRIHRSYAVNIERMSSFSESDVWVEKIQLPLGRNYREEFLNRFYFK